MTDLEIVRLCAEAMELQYHIANIEDEHEVWVRLQPAKPPTIYSYRYDPINDDAQCMALIKRFRLEILWQEEGETVRARYPWSVPDLMTGYYCDINRAVCLAVARMQADK